MNFFRALCGAAALLGVAQSVNAQIIYSGDEHIIISLSDYRVASTSLVPNPAALSLDLNGDGTADFSVFTYQPIPTLTFFGARGLNGSYYSGLGSLTLDRYVAGSSIGSGPQWSNTDGGVPPTSGQNWWSSSFYGGINSSFNGVGYWGIKLNIGGLLHYGWIAFELPAVNGASLTIDSWAYESAVGTPILAGDKGTAAASPVPEPSTYGIGAIGCLALVAGWRRGRRQKGVRSEMALSQERCSRSQEKEKNTER